MTMKQRIRHRLFKLRMKREMNRLKREMSQLRTKDDPRRLAREFLARTELRATLGLAKVSEIMKKAVPYKVTIRR